MIGVVLYTLIEITNYFLAYKCVLRVRFTKKRLSYLIAFLIFCVLHVAMRNYDDSARRNLVSLAMGFLGALILFEGKKWKIALLYPVMIFLPSLINTVASYGWAALMGISQKELCDSIGLVLLSECTAVILFIVYETIIRKGNREERKITVGQSIFLLVGTCSLFFIVAYSQGLLNEDVEGLLIMKNRTAIAGMAIAFIFFALSIWQQVTWRKAFRYQKENEEYKLFLTGQEKHIQMLIVEDERRRKLRHDMNTHMLALSTMVENQEWSQLGDYIQHMQESLGEPTSKYTGISAVDAIVEEGYNRVMEQHGEWLWNGALRYTERVTVFELCTVFSNLLNNALEAIENVKEKAKVEIKVSQFQDKMVLSIGNTCNIEAKDSGRPTTTKDDKVFHGWGLKNVEEVVKKHEGSIDYKVKDGWFQVDIVL